MFLMTSHLHSHTTTDVKPNMLSDVQTGNGIPHDKYYIHGIAHAYTNKKDDIFMQRRLYIEQSTHGAGHIPLCGIFIIQKSYIEVPLYNVF